MSLQAFTGINKGRKENGGLLGRLSLERAAASGIGLVGGGGEAAKKGEGFRRMMDLVLDVKVRKELGTEFLALGTGAGEPGTQD